MEGSGTVASLSLLGMRFQESHRVKKWFLLFWDEYIKQCVVCCLLVSDHLKLKATYVQETYEHFSSIAGYSCAFC